ncbi:hypothetical protein AAFX24_17670 [Vibrio mediterranei]|uniref:hypothetical protein n=1 Tax=Vibrio mediterranei TaxID=689 RepID=UPI0038CEBD69
MKWLNVKVSDEKLSSGYLVEMINVVKGVYPLGGAVKPVALYMEVTRSQIGWTNFYVSPAISGILQLKLIKDELCYSVLSRPPEPKNLMLIFGRNVFCYKRK